MSRADRHSYFALAAVLALMLHAAFVTVVSRTTIGAPPADSTRWRSPGTPLSLAFDEPAPPRPPEEPEHEIAREPEQPPPPTPEPPQPPPPEIVTLGIEDGTSSPTPAWLGFKDETEHRAHRSTVVQPQLDPDAGGPQESRPHGAGGDNQPPAPPAPSSTSATTAPAPPPESDGTESKPQPSEPATRQDPKPTEPTPATQPRPPVEDAPQPKPQVDAPSPETSAEEPVTPPLAETSNAERPAEAASGVDIELSAPRLELGPMFQPARRSAVPEPQSREKSDAPTPQADPETSRRAPAPPVSPEQLRELERLVDEMMRFAPSSPGGTGPAGDPSDGPASPSARPGAPAEPSDKQVDGTSLEEPIEIVLGHPAAAKGLEIITRRPQFSKITRVVAYPDNPLVEATFARDGRVIAARLTKSSGYADVDQPVLDAVYAWRAKGEALQKLPLYPEPGSAGAQAAAENPKAFGLTLKFTIILRDDR